MSRRRRNKYRNPNQIQSYKGNRWYNHYYQYLCSLAYQLFEWKNLPDSIDPRYLEMSLHMFGFVGFYKDPKLGFIVSQGAVSGTIDHYLLPTHFHAVSPTYQNTFKLFNYKDIKEDNMGVMIWNNDYHFPTLPSLEMFAQDLAELKEIIKINQNAQKTPVLIAANDNTKFSIQNMYNQYEGNAPAIYTHESLDPERSIKVFKTDAPYVVDKLNDQKNAEWNEVMTYLGINNANERTQDRVTATEINSNTEQIENSGSIWLKSRKEAVERIKLLYPELSDLDVDYRQSAIDEFMSNIQQTQMTGNDGKEDNQ